MNAKNETNGAENAKKAEIAPTDRQVEVGSGGEHQSAREQDVRRQGQGHHDQRTCRHPMQARRQHRHGDGECSHDARRDQTPCAAELLRRAAPTGGHPQPGHLVAGEAPRKGQQAHGKQGECRERQPPPRDHLAGEGDERVGTVSTEPSQSDPAEHECPARPAGRRNGARDEQHQEQGQDSQVLLPPRHDPDQYPEDLGLTYLTPRISTCPAIGSFIASYNVSSTWSGVCPASRRARPSMKPSFRPDVAICALRALSRHRAGLVESAAVHIQHMQKALTQMNLQIHHVLSDITGVSGMAIVEAIVAGQRDAGQLASLCHSKVHADRPTVIKSLTGNYRPEHLFTLKQSLAAYKNYQQLLAECDQEIQRLTGSISGKIDSGGPAPHPHRQKRRKNQFHFDMSSELHRLFGVDLTAVPGINALTAHALLSEVGTDLSRFPSAAAFANWLALCPNNKKSGGKILSSKTRPTNSRLSHALRVAAQTLARSRSHLGNFYRSMRARLGAPQAITATAHKLARILYHLLTTGSAYDESVFAQEQQKQTLRLHKRLTKQAKLLGLQLVPITTGDPCS